MQNGHIDIAKKEYEERKPNKFDIPVKKVRQSRPSILHTTTKIGDGFGLNMESIRGGKLNSNAQQPQTSMLPKKNRQLDINKIGKFNPVKDDTYDA